MPFVILLVGIQRFFRFLGGASDYDKIVKDLADAKEESERIKEKFRRFSGNNWII